MNKGYEGNLTRSDLATAARLSGQAIFQFGERPNVMSTDVALQFPLEAKSTQLQNAYMDFFGTTKLDNVEQMMTGLGYQYEGNGKWKRLDPITFSGTSGRYGRYGSRRGYGIRSGGSPSARVSTNGLVNWRIGL
jgi:hypothetical protein